ncbi:MAG: AAA family ATPase [Clostridia bacterium]|nr:AAA family ATPase [Clostridia bacterium]
MKIQHLRVNGFGKLNDKEINFNDGINIIYGENETGKSTLLKFISAMFYGTSKNKNGKNIPDFEKYKPWKTEEYSGTLNYKLDNGEEFSIYREFKRKNPIIYNNYKEDITKSFKEVRSGIDFLNEQIGLDEDTYFSTAITEQAEVILPLNKQNSLVQKISNKVLSGDDNISYTKSMQQISKLQNENVGTDRTSLRPLNIVNNKIQKLLSRKVELEKLKEDNEKNIDGQKLEYILKDDENKLSFIKKVKEFYENNRLKLAEINFNKNNIVEDDERIKELINELEKIEEYKDYKDYNNKNSYIRITIVLIIFLLLAVSIFLIRYNNAIHILLLICFIPLIIALLIMVKNKSFKNKIKKEFLSKKDKLKFELDNLKEKKRNKETMLDKKNEKLEFEMDKEKDSIINEYIKSLDINYIDEILNKTYENILHQIESLEKRISDTKIKIKEVEINKQWYYSKIEELSRIEEEFNSVLEEKEELLFLNKSYNIAKECLEKAYQETKKMISPKFTEKLSKTVSKISNGKYSSVFFNDEEGIMVKLENGNYVPIERLSIGTIDQMYLSLRLSAFDEISSEKIPIILDETFVFFDNIRLQNILKYLIENYKDNQIFILSCSNREKELLDKLNIEYNLINLEK